MSDDRKSESDPPVAPEVNPPGETAAAASAEEDSEDPEFARIPPLRRPRSPIVAAAVIGLGGLLLVHLVDDTRFALRSATPIDLGDARKLGAAGMGRLVDNSLVAVHGLPDLRNALLFEPKGDRYRRAFFRLLGTDTRLLVRADETSTRHSLDDRIVGRLRRFDKIPWAEQVRDYYASRVHVTRFVDLDLLKLHLTDGRQPLADRAGDRLTLGADEPIGVAVDFPEDLRVSLPKKQFPVEEDARHEIERLGHAVAASGATNDWYLYVVRVDRAGRDALIKQLEEHEWPFAARRERFSAQAGDLSSDGAALSIPFLVANPPEYIVDGNALKPIPPSPRTSLPWTRVASVQVAAPLLIPPDAFILVENELPADYLWTLLLDGLLALFVAFNFWLLIHYVRPRPSEEAPAPP